MPAEAHFYGLNHGQAIRYDVRTVSAIEVNVQTREQGKKLSDYAIHTSVHAQFVRLSEFRKVRVT